MAVKVNSKKAQENEQKIFLSPTSFARRLGVPPPVLARLLDKNPSIEKQLPVEYGNYRFDVNHWLPIFKKMVDGQTTAGASSGANSKKIPRGRGTKALLKTRDNSDDEYDGESGDDIPDDVVTYTDVRTKRELYASKKMELEYKRVAGKLVSARAVERVWEGIAVAVQKAVLIVPDRVTPLLVGETDQTIIHNRITTELKYALKNLAFALEQTAEQKAAEAFPSSAEPRPGRPKQLPEIE